MNKALHDTLLLRTCNCDMFGCWRPSAILECMQETAGMHSHLLGLSREKMRGMGLAWVLSRVKVEITRIPSVEETISIETYPTPNRHLFFPRSHIFRDGKGEVIGTANSLWMLMDLKTRRLTQSEEVVSHMPDNRDLKPAAGMPATVRALPADAELQAIEPVFTDFDTNGHVNNTKYLDWCCNALGMERMKQYCIPSFDVNYEAEILHGCKVRTELRVVDERFSFLGFDGEKQLFAISGKLEKR